MPNPFKKQPPVMVTTKTEAPVAAALLVALTVTALASSLGLSVAYLGVTSARRVAVPRTVVNVNRNVNANVNAAVPTPAVGGQFIRGDANMDGQIDVGDVTAIANYVNAGGSLACLDAADANDSGNVDIHDAAYLTAYLFGNGPKPSSPFPKAGADPTVDNLNCSPKLKASVTFIRGDANSDGQIDIGDAIAISNYVNSKGTLKCLDAADANDSGNVDIFDMAYVMYYLYSGGAAPKAPFPAAGEDLTADDLKCE